MSSRHPQANDNRENLNSCSGSSIESQRNYPDGGYGWFIVLASFSLYLIADGISYPLGLINSVWLEYFKESETKTSWVGSIFYATPLLSGPVMSKLIERYGCKRMTIITGAIGSFGFIISSLCTSIEQLYFTVGIVGGIGLSSAFVVGLLTVERWFEEKRSLAIGIVSAGTGFGTFIFPPITQFFLDKFGWRLTFVALSTLLMGVSLIGAFLDDPAWVIEEHSAQKAEAIERKRLNGDVKQAKNFSQRLKTFVDFSHFKNENFALLGLTTFIIYALYNTAIYFMTELLKNFDYTENQSATFLSVIGFFLMIGMVSLGWLADRNFTNVVWLNAACVLVCGVSEALMPFAAPDYIALSALCALFGFSFASAYVLIPKIAELIVGVDNFASAIGLNFFMQGLGLLVGTPFSGWIYEISGSWSVSFYVSGGAIAFSSVLAFLIKTQFNKNQQGNINQSNARLSISF